MIPKVIHYCWFGGSPLPVLAKKCIHSWREYCPEYTIVEWNENNYDISLCPLYVRQAYDQKKWAFVSDYARLEIIFRYGGIYLDTDVELLKSFDPLLKNNAFFGFEDDKHVATGLGFGAVANATVLKDMMDQYSGLPFIDEKGAFDTIPCVVRNTEALIHHGLIQNGQTQILNDDIAVFSSEYFCPKSFSTGEVTVTQNTFSIHHYDGSWLDSNTQRDIQMRWKRNRRKKTKYRYTKIIHGIISAFIGEERYMRLRKKLGIK